MSVRIQVGFSLFDWVVAKLPDSVKHWLPQVLLDRLKPSADEWQKTGEDFVNTKLEPFWAPLKPVIKVLTDLRGSTIGLFDKITKLANSLREEYEAIKNFKEDLHWRGRVVNAPQVVKKIKRLQEIPLEVVAKVKDMVKQIQDQFPEGAEPANLAEDAAKSLEGFEDFAGALERIVPKLAKGGEKLLGVVAILVQVLVSWNLLIEDMQTIVDDVKEVRLDVEKLDLIFLPQNNARQYVNVETKTGIKKSRWRIGGHLHPVRV